MFVLSQLPDELLGFWAAFLDTPSAGSFSKASKACKELVREQLAAAKAAKAAEAAAAAKRRVKYNNAGKAFIDAYLNEYAMASPTDRGLLVERILTAAAVCEELDSTSWTVASVFYRLANALKLRNRVA